MATLAAVPAAGASFLQRQAAKSASAVPLLPNRLRPGDTVGIVAPASATFQTLDVTIARESLEALGLKVRVGANVLARHGYLAGSDKERAADINAFFADAAVRAVFPIRGGWGSSRLLPHLDYDLIRKNPKVVVGYSDITALHLAIQAKTGLVTFHGPNGLGRWDSWSLDHFKGLLMDG